jgi:hypothetical protein
VSERRGQTDRLHRDDDRQLLDGPAHARRVCAEIVTRRAFGLFLDGHVSWRPFEEMVIRNSLLNDWWF